MRDLTIRWIGQSGYILSDGIAEICVDPYLSNVVDRIAKLDCGFIMEYNKKYDIEEVLKRCLI